MPARPAEENVQWNRQTKSDRTQFLFLFQFPYISQKKYDHDEPVS